MDTAAREFLLVSLFAVLAGWTALALLIRRELAPLAGLGKERQPQRWFLLGAGGAGLLAFTLKLVVALLLTGLPTSWWQPLLQLWSTPAGEGAASEWFTPASGQRGAYRWQALPEHFPSPPDNPTTPAKVVLGERLFNDTRLSGDGRQSCASCHQLDRHAGADGRPTAVGIADQRGQRNTPTVWNSAFQARLFWDGRAASLEEQAGGPILNPIEMGLASAAEAERRLNADPGYRTAFAQAFGDRQPITFQRLTQALAAYERTLITPDTPYDRFVWGDRQALSAQQQRGMALFERIGCVACHRGPNFSDASWLEGQNPLRLFPATPSSYDQEFDLLLANGERGVWRVPSLRNVALTGPWLHNGRATRLEDAVRIMSRVQLGRSGGRDSWVNADQTLGGVDRSLLSEGQIADLVAFLHSLSSDRLRAAQESPGRHD
jgi:cytochrome c peroxidase